MAATNPTTNQVTNSAAPKQIPKTLKLLAFGGAAGLTEVLLLYPLDVVKTRWMLHVDRPGSVGVFGTLREIVRVSGVKSLYRGILPPICMEAPKRAVKFATNDTVNPILLSWSGATSPGQGLAIASGACAGVAEAHIVAPFEKIKIRMQDAKGLGKYTSSIDCLKKTVLSEGPLSLAKGLQSTICAQGVWNAGYFGTIWRVRSLFSAPKSKVEKIGTDLIAGSSGGLIGTMMNNPFDMIKSRIQNMEVPRGGKLPNTFAALAQVAREEGLRAWYKGFGPKSMRLVPGGGILLAIFEQAKDVF